MPPKPIPAFPEPAAALPDESPMLAAVVADLADDTTKLVYADWLEEHNDPRGRLLRATVAAFRAGKKLPSTKKAPESWRDLVGITLMERMRAAEMTAHADTFFRLARPALTFGSTRMPDAKLPVGASKLGGLPDLPAGTKWPSFREEPLAFLGQFNLADLAQSFVCRELPSAGLLSVFCVYGEEEGNDDFPKGAWRLLYFPDGSKLSRVSGEPETVFRPCRVQFGETLTLPEKDSPWRKEIGLGRDDEAWWTYQETVVGFGGHHQILGYPGQIQGDVLGKKTMRHLLTIGPDDNTDWMWGDGGSLYFTLPEADLKAGRFDRVRFEMQCG